MNLFEISKDVTSHHQLISDMRHRILNYVILAVEEHVSFLEFSQIVPNSSLRIYIGFSHQILKYLSSEINFNTTAYSYRLDPKETYEKLVKNMAKWGEGDPRWIVEERPDATNVNNWHWTEKNAGPWSLERIKELFKNIPVQADTADLEIEGVEKCDGEACANNRKGKLIFFYEWDIILNWCGTLKNGTDRKHSGTIKVPNLSEENDMSDLDIQIALKDPDEEGEILREIMLEKGKSLIRDQLGQYVISLKEEFSKGMILPKKDDVKPDNIKTLASGFNNKVSMAPVVSQNKATVHKIDTTSISQTHKFQCTAEDFYNALTRIEMVTAFTRGHVKLDLVKGGNFALFGGNITGKFEELVPNKKIVKQWRYKQWPEGHYSTVSISIDQKGDHTEVKLHQIGVPIGEAEVTKTNWDRYYWDAMKQAFGFGVFLGDI